MSKDAFSIKDVLSSVILNMSGEKREKIGRIKEAWKEAVDKKALVHTQPAAFKAKRLVVNIDASAWMYELNLQKQQIKTKLNEELKKDNITINEIIFRIGEVR